MFNDLQRQRLRDLSRVRGNIKPDFNHVNAPLEKYIRELETEYPELFHTYNHHSRRARVFVDQPLNAIPYDRCLRGPGACPYNLIEKST
jgi:hypothetical protein